ncbi:MAG: uroporphyrinogen-III synthase [Bacteroidota bacterium]|nr:uroporphyrinogen-III synthase [Bacteroidota bacterium]MDP4216183.1 uroporphyrinogen-III synthase [Bacteroidota bacterium]MDP4247043.1 uroporphyrinogen-III synthase [Bacteroidota bacterium]MDP4253775.1 uroporphyrinogen-III synthase [Bacteroidota bacterium]MDP4258325.1 uroporphyrinogen-III synthase [Bacteroidota bacterium]
MIEKQIHILSTRPLDLYLLEAAASEGVSIGALSFISTQPVTGPSIGSEIAGAALSASTVVFTSRHAVEAVIALLGRRPDWKIFCTGHATREWVERHFGREAIMGTAGSAAGLADKIIAMTSAPAEILFFCGDQRLDELPKRLLEKGFRVREVIVYKTVLTPRLVEDHYDGIIFFSPSAVTSFFSSNKPAPGSVLFAIGPTTAEAIREKSGNTILVSESPDKEEFIREIIRYVKSGDSSRQTETDKRS